MDISGRQGLGSGLLGAADQPPAPSFQVMNPSEGAQIDPNDPKNGSSKIEKIECKCGEGEKMGAGGTGHSSAT